MTFFSQNSWFTSNQNHDSQPDLPDFSQDLLTSQDLASGSQYKYFDSQCEEHCTLAEASQLNQSLEPSQFFKTPVSAVNYSYQIEASQSQSYFESQLKAEVTFLEENAAFIFDDESEEMEIDGEPEELKLTPQTSYHSASVITTSSPVVCSGTSQAANEVLDFNDDPQVPHSILKLYEAIKSNHSDAVFTSTLAMSLCTDFFPMRAYKNLKLALLLSLASVCAGKTPIPIVGVGQETSHANTVLTAVGQFADRFITSLNNIDGSSVKRDGVIEAGQMLMAKGGVFYIGDWAGLQPNLVTKLLREIETGRVTTEKVQQSLPLECAVWTYWSCSMKVKKDVKSINQFMSVFGIPIMIDDVTDEWNIIEDILRDSPNENAFRIPDDDMRAFLKHIAMQPVEIDEEAEELLAAYFKATRMIRQNALSPKAFEILKQFAESHARLSLRQTVNQSDILAAINISEKYIRIVFDKDSFSSPVEPAFSSLEDIDIYQKQLLKWLKTFANSILNRKL